MVGGPRCRQTGRALLMATTRERTYECVNVGCEYRGRQWTVPAEQVQDGLLTWPDVACAACGVAPHRVDERVV